MRELKRDKKGRFVSSVVHGFKGFKNGLVCCPESEPFRYKVGETFTMGGWIEPCRKGFHFCIRPIDVFDFYPPIHGNEYARVSALGVVVHVADGHKSVTSKLRVDAKLSYADFADYACRSLMQDCPQGQRVLTAYGEIHKGRVFADDTICITQQEYDVAEGSGERSVAIVTAEHSISRACDIGSVSVATNWYSIAQAERVRSAAICSRPKSLAVTRNSDSVAAVLYNGTACCTGPTSAAVAIGGYAQAGGYGSVAVAVGAWDENWSMAEVSTPGASAVNVTPRGLVKGVKGSWLCAMVYEDYIRGDQIQLLTAQVDGVKIKENTWYTATKDGWKEVTLF